MPIDQILEDVQKLTSEDKQRLLDALAKDQTAKLTPEQKLAINDYVAQIVSKLADWLGKVAAAIGILSVLSLASSLGYVFFILPDKAVTISQGSIERRLGERTKTIEEGITKILKDYGSEQESYKNLSKKSDAISQDLEKRASELDDKFKTLEQGPTSKAADVVKAVQTNATGSDLLLDVSTLKTDVDTLKKGAASASQRIDKLEQRSPVFLPSSEATGIVLHYGDLGTEESPVITAMTDAGVVVDCKKIGLKIPDAARGAIVKVMVGRRGGDRSSGFVPADSNGLFPSGFNNSIGFSNYTGTWAGGTVLCPFFQDQQFKYKLSSNSSTADQTVGCFAYVVGYYY